MSIILGGVTVTDNGSDMVWSDRYTSQSVEQSQRRTLGGRLVVYSGELVAGRLITLEATENYGWVKKSRVDALLALAAVPGAIYSLQFGAENYSVLFDHSSGSAVDMHPILPSVIDDPESFMTGSIKLITV